MNQILNSLNVKQLPILVLGFSLLFFLLKGIQYALISSYIPLFFALTFMILLVYFAGKSVKSLKIVLSVWALMIVTWAFMRLVLGFATNFIRPLSEAHVNEQLGFFGTLWSLLFLAIGIFLIRNRNRTNQDIADLKRKVFLNKI